jgi:uncharacterized membrane protein
VGSGLVQDVGFRRMIAVEPAVIVGLLVVAGLFTYVPLGSSGWERVAYNAVLLATIAGVLARGIREGRPWMVNMAVTFIAFEAVARYVDSFWGYLGRSAAFLVSGVLLLAGGWLLERQRRLWLTLLRRREARA